MNFNSGVMVIKAKNAILLKGGILINSIRGYKIPSWLTADVIRIIDKLVFMRDIIAENAEGEKIFKYIVERSGIDDLPILREKPTDENPIMTLYYIISCALNDPFPGLYFIKRVRIDGHNIVILEIEGD